MTVEEALGEFLSSHHERELYIYLRSVDHVYKVHSFNMEPSMAWQRVDLVFCIGNLQSARYSTRLVVAREWDYSEGGVRFVEMFHR